METLFESSPNLFQYLLKKTGELLGLAYLKFVMLS